ncbi:hypothetical protein TcWFU_004678 [Taenia crassiceps]|uniref:Uncharacterized protein n=1 Tax=Taenia crassiceps TaxID=6207 RepID=A0ABR4QDJ1_9CEST
MRSNEDIEDGGTFKGMSQICSGNLNLSVTPSRSNAGASTRHPRDVMTIKPLDDSRNLVSYERSAHPPPPPPPPPRQPQVHGQSTDRSSTSEVDEPVIYPPDLGYHLGSQNDFRVQKFSC